MLCNWNSNLWCDSPECLTFKLEFSLSNDLIGCELDHISNEEIFLICGMWAQEILLDVFINQLKNRSLFIYLFTPLSHKPLKLEPSNFWNSLHSGKSRIHTFDFRLEPPSRAPTNVPPDLTYLSKDISPEPQNQFLS